jgi:heavy metal sensor kinase
VFKSIRWNLLFWYSIILFAVIAAFGAAVFLKLESSMRKSVEAELRAHAMGVQAAFEFEEEKFKLELSEEYAKYFKGGGKHSPYFVIWDRDGKILERSGPQFESSRVEPGYQLASGNRRALAVAGPEGSVILVGRDVRKEVEKLHEWVWSLVAAGGGAMLLALAGGWFLASRALKPIRTMSDSAAAISASNLSQRIGVEQTESELGQLAKTLNEAFDRLEQAFERQTRFTADASHELRTPLAIVMSQAELALRKERSPEEYREALATALKASQRMKAVVEGLLTLARADAKELEIRKERVDLGKVVEETASLLGSMAIERRVALTVSAEPVSVTGDPDRLREVVTNLLTNAIRYNREGGKVDVSLSTEKEQAVLTVADTGIGIPEKDQPHLFERFYRVDKARSRAAGGTGLGLSIVKNLVLRMEGEVRVASVEGQGSTFKVILPLA